MTSADTANASDAPKSRRQMEGFGILELAVIVAIGTFVLFVFGKIFAQAGYSSWLFLTIPIRLST